MTDTTLLAEGQFGTGAIDQIEDKRDKTFRANIPFDWALGFDIELLLGYRKTVTYEEFWGVYGPEGWGLERYKEIVEEVKNKGIPPFKMPTKNQGASSSCTGQGLAEYLSVLNFIETGEWLEISPRDIYAYISLGWGKGAYLRDALKLSCSRGIGTEELVPSYTYFDTDNGPYQVPMTEDEYLVKPEETDQLIAIRTALQSKFYRSITSSGEALMEDMAWAILMGFGCYFAVYGTNNGTWTSEYPQPPIGVPNDQIWGHALYAGKALLDSKDNQPAIFDKNSWGDSIGVDGWQKLKLNYFKSGNVISPWTLIDKENKHMQTTNVLVLQKENKSDIVIALPVRDEAAMLSYGLNFGFEVPTKADGSVDWPQIKKDGTFKINQ